MEIIDLENTTKGELLAMLCKESNDKTAFMNLAQEQSKLLNELSNDNNESIRIAGEYKKILDMYDAHPWKHLWSCLLRKIRA